MLRCKSGDLAIVLRSTSDREGRICLVDQFVGMANLQAYGIYYDVWAVSYGDSTHSPEGARWGSRDCDLLPIRPDELKETEETEKELTNAE